MRRNELDLASQPVRNLITNPAMKTKSTGTDTVLINYAATGNFEGASSATASIGGSPAQWATSGQTTDRPHSGTKSFKLGNCTTAGQAARKALTNPLTELKVSKGQKISWSFWIYSTVAGDLSLYWEGVRVNDGAYAGGGVSTGSVSVPANKWTYISGTSTPMQYDTYVHGAGGYGLPVPVGASVWWDEFCITLSDTPYPYFDGNTPAADGYVYSWSGTAYNSSSMRKSAATIVRTNLVSNPSFKGGTLSTVRTNLLTNPSFESNTGNTDVWTNNVMNPSFRGTSGTTLLRTNLFTNPSFETSTGTNDVWTNLVTNPSFEAAGGAINVRTNLVSNPSFESATSSTVARTNLSANPRGISAFADYSGASNQTITPNVTITGHPEGLTTANRVSYTTGANPGVTLLMPTAGTTYTLSAWVYHESTVATPGSQGFAQAGVISMSNPPTITTGVWQRFYWTHTPSGANQIGFRVSAQSGTGTGSFLITGVQVETVNAVLPFFDGSTPAAVRTNWASDPRALSTAVSANKLGWRNSRWFGGGSGAGTYTLVTGAGDGVNGITSYLRKTWTVAGASNGDTGFDHGYGGTSGLPILPNTYYTASSYIRSSASGKTNAGMQIVFYDSAGTQVGSSIGTLQSLSAGVWTRISHTAQAPATAYFMAVISDVDSGTLWSPGEYLDGTGLMVEQGGLANFFDGYNSAREGYTFGWRDTAGSSISYATDGDYTYAWTGTANASTSQLRVTGATNIPVVNTRTFTHQSSGWFNKGSKSLRVTTYDSSSTDTFAILEGDTGAMRMGMVAGKTYTISGTIRLVAEQTGTLSARARKIVLFYNTTSNQVYQEVHSNQASNAVGVERVKLTFTLPSDTTEAFVRLYNGAANGCGEVWWDSAIVEEGITAGEFFDGANPITNLCTNPDLEVNTNGWTAENGAVLTRDSYYLPGPGGWSGKVTGAGGDVYTSLNNMVKGETYTFSVDYKGTGTQTGTPRLYLRVGSGAYATTNLPLTQVTPKRFSVSLTATESGQLVAAIFNGTGANDSFWFDNVLIENGSSSMFYYGNGDYTYAWTGTANNSPSAQQAPSAAAVIGGNARTFQSGVWSKGGGKSVRLVPMDVSGSNATSAQIPVTLVAGKTYTVLATRFLEKPITGVLNSSYAGRIALIQPGLSTLSSDALPNTAGEGTIRWTFTVDASATGQTLRIGHGGSANTGEVWWDKVLVVEGTYAGEYFDGTVPALENLAKTAPSNLDGVNQTVTTGVSFAGQTWTRAAVTVGTGGPTLRHFAALSDLENGQTYTFSLTVANDQSVNQNVYIDWCDIAAQTFTILPGEIRRIKISGSKPVYDIVYRFADFSTTQSSTEARSLLFKDVLIEKGTTSGDYYSGTGDFTYAWTGATNASTSVQRGANMTNWLGATNAQIYQNSISSAKYGSKCAAVVTKGFNGDGIFFNDLTVTAGTTYTFSAWIKSAVALPRLDFHLRWKDAATATISDTMSELSVGLTVGQWSRISLTAVAPANTVKVSPMIRIYATGYTPVTFYVDGAMLEATPVLMPYFDGSVPVNQNLFPNPSLETNLTNWGWFSGGTGSGSAVRQTSGGYNGPCYIRMTWSVSQTGSNLGGVYIDAPGILSGEVYSAGVKARVNKNQKLRATFEWLNSGGKLVSTSIGADTDVLANTWSDVKVENATAPVGAVTARLTIYSAALGTPWLVGDTLDVDAALLERSTTLSPYYEGTGDFTYDWSGTAHASASNQRAVAVVGNVNSKSSGVGFVDSKFYTYQSTDETGKKIGRWFSPAGTPNSSWRVANITGASLNYASIVAGSTYTLLIRYRATGWNSGSNFYISLKDGTSSNPVIGDDTPRLINTTGWVEYRRTFVALINGLSSTNLYVTLPLTPQATTDGIFDIAEWALIPGAYTGPFFDGSSATTTSDYVPTWSGTADASVSTLRGTAVSDIVIANFGDNNSKAVNSTEWSASTGKSMRIIPVGTASGTDTAITLAGSASSGLGPMVAGKTYTVKATFRQAAPQTGTLHARARGIMFADSVIGWSSPPVVAATNTAGSQTLTHTFTVSAGATWATVRLYNGASAGNGDVWWDDVVMVEGPYTGGYFDGTKPEALRTNLVPDPSFELGSGGWFNNGQGTTVASDSTQMYSGTKSLRVVPAVENWGYHNPMSLLSPGKTYTFSIWVRSDSAQTLCLTNYNTPVLGPSVSVPANTWTRLSLTQTIPANATAVWISVRNPDRLTTPTPFYMDAYMIEESSSLGTYFDGATSAVAGTNYTWTGTANASSSVAYNSDFTYAWAGTANASQSYQKALSLPNWGIESKLITYVTANGTLTTIVKDPNGGGGRSIVPFSSPLVNLAFTQGNKYTVVIRGRKFDSSTAYRLNGAAPYVEIPLTTSMSTQTITFTATAGVILYIEHPSGLNTSGMELEYFGVFAEGDPVSYFDGDTSGTDGLVTRWKGTQWASQSEQIGASVASFTQEPYIRQWALPDGAMRTVNITGSTHSLQTPNIMTTGRVYTLLVRAKAYRSGTFTIYGFGSARSVTLTTSYAWYRITGTADGPKLFFSTLGNSGSGFDISHMMVTEGTYTGAYLDGSSYGSRWEGTSHAAPSLGITPSLEALAGKPLAYLTAVNASTTLGEEITPSQPRTIYSVVDMLQDLPGTTLDTIWSYGATSLDDSQDPNKTLIMRLQSQDGGNHNMIYTRRTGGGGKGTLDVPSKGRQIFIAGLGENQVLFSGHNFSTLGYDDTSLVMNVPHQRISMSNNSVYHTHVATYIFAGVHDDTVRAEIVKALALKHEVPIL